MRSPLGVVRFRNWRPSKESHWLLVRAALLRWTAMGKALLYNSEGVPVDIGTYLAATSLCTMDATLEIYDEKLWRVWASSAA